jgi:hypothetical protein
MHSMAQESCECPHCIVSIHSQLYFIRQYSELKAANSTATYSIVTTTGRCNYTAGSCLGRLNPSGHCLPFQSRSLISNHHQKSINRPVSIHVRILVIVYRLKARPLCIKKHAESAFVSHQHILGLFCSSDLPPSPSSLSASS